MTTPLLRFFGGLMGGLVAVFTITAKAPPLSLDDDQAHIRRSLSQWELLPTQQSNFVAQFSPTLTIATPADVVREAQRLAAEGDARAQCLLGLAYVQGFGVAVDKVAALQWFRRSATNAVPEAQVWAGQLLLNGEAGETNPAEALVWFQRAAAKSLPAAWFHLGVCYQFGHGTSVDLAEAARFYELAAAKNYAPATCSLGALYDRGLGKHRDQQYAFELYRRSAEQEYPLALFDVGVSYARGEGINQSYVEAAKWYRRAAVLGHVPAMHNLGNALMNGRGVPRDPVEAARWFREAGEAGVLESRAALALLILDKTVPGDVAAVLPDLEEASAQGSLSAQTALGLVYSGMELEFRQFVAPDHRRAASLLTPSANAGFPRTQMVLGLLIWQGRDVPHDQAEAYKWLTLAARQKEPGARHYLNDLGLEIAPQDMAEGLRRAAVFRVLLPTNGPNDEIFHPGLPKP